MSDQVVFARLAGVRRVGEAVTLADCHPDFEGRRGVILTAKVADDLRDTKCTLQLEPDTEPDTADRWAERNPCPPHLGGTTV